MTANLSFSNLFTYAAEDSSRRLPVTALSGADGHIHGLLSLEISGRTLPHMGFFGPDDVCFNTWLEELSHITKALADLSDAEYIFDEGEQGQPAFSFKRRGSSLLVSVVASNINGTEGDSGYQEVGCEWSAFQSAVKRFHGDFRSTLTEHCPAAAEDWWREHAAL